MTEEKEEKARRLLLLLAGAIFLMAMIGVVYERFVRPTEPVWNEKATRIPKVPLVVDYEDFNKPTELSIELWNNIMPRGQDLFIAGEIEHLVPGEMGVKILSANGEPCGQDGWKTSPSNEGHAAHAYQCPDGKTWEIHVFSPGDTRDQLCIIAHELGHVLGLADDKRGRGIMNNTECADVIRISDTDNSAVVERFSSESGEVE